MPKPGTSIRITLVLALAALATAALAATAGAAPKRHAATLTGAGSTLIQPAVQGVWGPGYAAATGTQVNYSGIGSSGGIAAITGRTVDFGASDAPLSADQMTACNGCVQIPWALSATVPTYNVPGVGDTKLRLTGPVLANMFLGHITNWNDAAIKKLNPGLSLPNLKITIAHRSDGSGDTYAFTDYLSKVSSEWRANEGANTTINWPAGVGGRGNAGVAAVISSTPGAIGYVSDAYALGNHLSKARLRNAYGKFTLPGITGIEDAAQTVKKVPADNRMSIVDPPATKKYAAAWPISTFTYIIVPTNSKNATDLRHFIFWALSPKQQLSIKKLIFAPIPKVVLVAAEKTLLKIHAAG